MPTLICGSLAFDTIMVFPDRFKNYILPDQIHILNVCFVNPELRREFGGCAGNIAYNLKLLGGDPLPMGTVGKDFSDYRQRLVALGISDEHILEIPELYSAQCSITTDQDNNQITAFHPGAMGEAHRNSVANANGVSLGIVAPDGKEAMIQHAHDFAAESIPFMFDPGQNLPLFSKDELMTFLDQATWCVMNDYESQLMMNTTGESINTLAQQVDALIVTRGGEGSVVYTDGDEIEIPTVNVDQAIDPTGCGDAYRAGLLLGLEKGWDWQTSGRVGSLIGAIKVQQEGTQNHQFSMEEFSRQYSLNFGLDLPA
ncbi:MAG: carbohydrate kinase family protein [Proteobacteria bacterium]|nr:carbohydrate kinase family protein [Pseudomonadota bacterium]